MIGNRWKILIALTCFLFLAVLSSSASAGDTYVVYKPGTSPCTTAYPDDSAHYHNSIQSAIDAIYSPDDNDGDTIIVCSGTYEENILIKSGQPDGTIKYKCDLTLKSFTQNPSDTIIKAANENDKVIYI